MAEIGQERLVGWKAIGAFLGRDARTAQRWEAERGLPVHRAPGGDRPTVWADPGELRCWLEGGSTAREPVPPAPARPRARPAWLAMGAITASTTLGFALILGATHGASPSPPFPHDPVARDLVQDARFAWSRRTPEGLETARRDYEALTRRHPDEAAGWTGLADTYLLLREFGAWPEPLAYARARSAAAQALSLDPDNADATREMAFIAFWHDANVDKGLDLFRRAVALAPRDERAHHWYANALAARGNWRKALAEIDAALQIAPGSAGLSADKAWILIAANRRVEARPRLEQIVRLEPRISSARRYLGLLDLLEGRDRDGFEQVAEAARLRGASAEAEAVESLARSTVNRPDPRARLRYARLEEQGYATGRIEASVVAMAWALAGDRARTLQWLGVARRTQASNLAALPGDPVLATVLRQDPSASTRTS